MEMEMQESTSSGSSLSDEEEPERPNCWSGPPSTWAALTAQERGLETSLTELRNQDLSLHLYNSFALERDARLYTQSKKRKLSASPVKETLDSDGEEVLTGQAWRPQKVWSAWPLPPDRVPRPDERAGVDDEDEGFTFKRRERERPSRELEEVLVGTALRFARERWVGREEVESEEEVEDGDSGDEMDSEGYSERSDDEENAAEGLGDHDAGDGLEVQIKEQSISPEEVIKKPVVAADDESSRRILRPSIRHTLSQLDAVLMALHHARQTYHRYMTDSEADSEVDSEAGTEDENVLSSTAHDAVPADAPPAKRPVGRPRKFENLTSRPKPESGQVTPPGDGGLWRAKPTHRGRPRKHYERLEGETEEVYLVRVARLQKKPLPAFTSQPNSSPEPSPLPLPPLKRRRTSRTRERLEPRDWSEVLGSAALVGLPPDVIARTAQRCADIFGDQVTMLDLVEGPAGAEKSDFRTTYRPEEIPDLSHGIETSAEDGDGEGDSEGDIKPLARRPSKRDLSKQHNWPCPIDDCPRQARGFSYASGLTRHLKEVHDLAADEVHEILDSDEEMHGGVHVDGFLKLIPNTKGTRGMDKGARRSGRWSRGPQVGEEESTKMEEERNLSGSE